MQDEWGFHRYAGKEWINPFDALDHAIERGDRSPDIAFVFPAADRLDWTVEPEEPLAELYRQRAQRLREEYGYLILMYSGGSDCHQVLMSFLNGGIPLDEVRTCYPMQWVAKVSGTVGPKHPLGLLYEYHHAAVPGLRLVSLRSPSTRITVVDTTDAYLTRDMAEWYEAPVQPLTSGGSHGLFRGIFRARVERELQRDTDAIAAKRVGVIYGAEKPQVRLAGQDVSVCFLDTNRTGVGHLWVPENRRPFDPVMFYWGEPRITCKQAHVIKRALERDQRIISDEDARRGLIYPDWHWSYQSPASINAALLETCAGDRARSIAAERTRYYNGRFGALANVRPLTDEPAESQRSMRLMCTRQTKFYHIGSLASVPSRSSGPAACGRPAGMLRAS